MSKDPNQQDAAKQHEADQDAEIQRNEKQLEKQKGELEALDKKIEDEEKKLGAAEIKLKEAEGKLEAVEFDGAKGGKQRLRIEVPKPEAVLSVGQQDGKHGFNGISGVAADHVAFVAEQKLSLQGNKHALMQADTALVFGKEKAVMGSAEGEAFVGAAKGVLIVAGNGFEYKELPKAADDLPDVPLPTYPESEHAADLAKNIAEGVFATATATAAILGGLTGTADLMFGIASVAASGTALGSGLIGEKNAAMLASGEAMVMGGRNAVFGSSLGTSVLGGVQAEMVAAGKVEMAAGGLAIVLAGGKAALEAGYKAEVLGGVKAEIASRRGKVELLGKEVEIGSQKAERTQLPTQKVELSATESLGIDIAGGKLKLEMGNDASAGAIAKLEAETTIEMEAKNAEIGLKAKNRIELKCGEWIVNVDDSNKCIKIGKESGYPKITVHENDGITLSLDSSDNNSISLHSNTGLIMRSNGNTMKFTNDSVNLNSGSLKVGK